MSRRLKIWMFAALALLLYAVAAWLLGDVLRPRLQERDIMLLRVGVVVLGVFSAAIIVWFFRAPAEEAGTSANC